MRRPCLFTRTSSTHARYNPIYEETKAKKAEVNQNPRWSFPTFSTAQPPEHETAKPQPQQSGFPPPRTSGTFFATHHNTYTPTSGTDNIYDAAENGEKPTTRNRRKRRSFLSFSFFGVNGDGNRGEDLDVNDDYGYDYVYDYRSNPFNDETNSNRNSNSSNRSNPFLDPITPEDNSNNKKNKKPKKSKPNKGTTNTNSFNEKTTPQTKKQNAKSAKAKAKEQERTRKRNSGLGWAKSISFGGERFGGTILADASGLRMPIFRCKGPCGLGCGFLRGAGWRFEDLGWGFWGMGMGMEGSGCLEIGHWRWDD
ncbi:hypothetical protein EYC80_008529 [Monilinia laxa]|uniref:Uncharacterized protein n=1 Tax=Monilinia laxa TaxID=61186 RepID=A0A5N6JT50_MONLA|nr:hypothetical protein EYC80_008529 [Monilinia laxa]